ncbi:MAG: DUF1003 domain-containing protein [Acidimicrobiales bacterium]
MSRSCPTCDRPEPRGRWRTARQLVPSVRHRLEHEHSQWTGDAVCRDCADEAEMAHMRELILETGIDMDDDAEAVLASIRDDQLITTETEDDFDALESRHSAATRLVEFFASWSVVAAIVVFLVVWTLFNVIAQPFEPYPMIVFAVISAVLASVAAIEGPIILMNQRIQRERDRIQSRADYRVNLKAELEIQYLDEKVELLLENQGVPER